MSKFNVKVKVTNADKLSHVVNYSVEAPSANHAKGEAQMQVQRRNPGMNTEGVDVYEVKGSSLEPKGALQKWAASGASKRALGGGWKG